MHNVGSEIAAAVGSDSQTDAVDRDAVSILYVFKNFLGPDGKKGTGRAVMYSLNDSDFFYDSCKQGRITSLSSKISPSMVCIDGGAR